MVTTTNTTDTGGIEHAWERALHVALSWAARGIPVFPIGISHDHAKYDGAGGLNKRPLTDNGHHNATTNTDQIRALYTEGRRRIRHHEQPGTGLWPGPAGYVVIDIDRKGDHNGYIAASNLGLQDTWGARTPSGGEHRIWRKTNPDRWVGNSSPWAGIDIRGDAGWIVAPGTHTTWGTWSRNDIDDTAHWPNDVRPLPIDIWQRLDLHDTAPATDHVRAQHQRHLTDHLAATLHPDTLAAWEHLRDHHGAHSPLWNAADGHTWLMVTRPGKTGWGGSADIGSRAPGRIYNHSSSWPGIPLETPTYVANGHLVDETTWLDHLTTLWTIDPNPTVEAAIEAAHNAGHDDPDIHQLLAREDEPYDWLVEGLIERGDRLILTGLEGKGKSTLLRQIAICISAGLHPFTHQPIHACRTLYVDLENSERQIRRKIRPLYELVAPQIADRDLVFHIKPDGLDLTDQADRIHLDTVIRTHTPDVVVIGPIYKLHSGDPIEERPAKQVATFIDYLRTEHRCAFLIEAHTPYAGSSNGKRPERPYGASLWSRWPEFGIFLSDTGQLSHWRGQRDERDWPKQLRRADTNTWPWEVEENPRQVTYARMVDVVRELGYIPSNRDIAKEVGCAPTTVGNAIRANQREWDWLRAELGDAP